MTKEEKRKIENCRVIIVGKGDLADAVGKALAEVGFPFITLEEDATAIGSVSAEIMVEPEMNVGLAAFDGIGSVVYAFDLIKGAGAMVVNRGEKPDTGNYGDIRTWAAHYMAGYCAFWNVAGCDWLQLVLPMVERGEETDEAQAVAANLCARIVANIAVGRKVKKYPRFYLCRKL